MEPTRSMWLALDDQVFWVLNGSLSSGKSWQVFWTVANNRAVDIVTGLSMVGLLAYFVYRNGRDRTNGVLSIFSMLVVLGIVGSQIGKAMNVNRASPTMDYPDALRLSELVPWIPTKDISGDSFPGDHATVLLICAGLITFYLPRSYAVAAWVIAIVFMAPRVVGGAHWLTDDLVGSVAIAGFLLSCVLATPLHRVMKGGFESAISRMRTR